jgi:hypothetical protein
VRNPCASPKWRKGSAVDLKLSALKTRRQIEAEWWSEYSLAGIAARSVPEWIDDQVISDWIWQMVTTEMLPWKIDEEWFQQVSAPHDRDTDDDDDDDTEL